MAAFSVYSGFPGVVDDPGTQPHPSRVPEQGTSPVAARRGARGGASPAGRSEASTGGAGGPRRSAPQARSWYIAGTVPPPCDGASELTEADVRRRVRLARRRVSAGWLIGHSRELEGLPREAPAGTRHGDEGWIQPPRVASCGSRIAGAVGVHVGGGHENAHLSGVSHCASIWACPFCSAVIRAYRAAEVTEAVERHTKKGGRLAFVTLTMRHDVDDQLAVNLDAALEGWRRVIRGRPWEKRRDAYGLAGYVRAVEVTVGDNGWHPHIHALLFLDHDMSEDTRADFEAWLFARWSRMVTKLGGGMPSAAHGCRVDLADDDGQMLAQYLSKVQEKQTDGTRWGVASELVRSDMKTTRIVGNRTPFELLDATDERSRELWIEYVEATRGRRAITWSKNLREDLGMKDECTDEDILEDTDPAPLLVGIPRQVYDARRSEPHWIARVLEAAEVLDMPTLLTLTDGYLPTQTPPTPEPPPSIGHTSCITERVPSNETFRAVE